MSHLKNILLTKTKKFVLQLYSTMKRHQFKSNYKLFNKYGVNWKKQKTFNFVVKLYFWLGFFLDKTEKKTLFYLLIILIVNNASTVV